MELKEDDDIAKLMESMCNLNETVPSLISGIIGTIYKTDDGTKIATSTTKFYKELTNTGMQKEHAYKLTREYLKVRDLSLDKRNTDIDV